MRAFRARDFFEDWIVQGSNLEHSRAGLSSSNHSQDLAIRRDRHGDSGRLGDRRVYGLYGFWSRPKVRDA